MVSHKMSKIYILFLFVTCVSCSGNATLRLVNLVYRHGDRSPIMLFPTDPNTADNWPQGFGWLSKIGMGQQYRLGQWLRERYVDSGFMSTDYNRSQLHVESSDEERCLMSAYCNLAGLYPPNENETFDPSIHWQPIPVHTRPGGEDNMLNLGKVCPRYDELLALTLKAHDVTEEEKENKKFYDHLDILTGWKHENISNIWRIADTLICEKAHNLTLANWTNDIWENMTYYDKLRQLETYQFTLLFRGAEKTKLKGGPLLGQFIQNMQAATTANDSTVKMFMYSAHDTTVAALLTALGLWNNKSPQYTSTVITELHQNTDGKYYVNVYYKNVTDNATAVQLTINGCELDCPLDEFVRLLSAMVPKDWDKECGLPSPTPSHKIAKGWIVSIVLGVLLLIMVVINIICCLRHKKNNASFLYGKFDVDT